MINSCLVCERISQIKSNKNSNFIFELETSYVVFADSQFYAGYVLLLSKYHQKELHELTPKIKDNYLKEMSLVAEAIYKVYQPKKLNYELLGNSHSHLHWHIIPRYKDDLNLTQPIWVIDQALRNNKPLSTIETEKQIATIRGEIIQLLSKS